MHVWVCVCVCVCVCACVCVCVRLYLGGQESRTPLDKQLMGAVWEECKDLGVLFGKGGNFGNVSTYTRMMLLLRIYFVSQTMMMMMMMMMMCYAMLPCLPQTQA